MHDTYSKSGAPSAEASIQATNIAATSQSSSRISAPQPLNTSFDSCNKERAESLRRPCHYTTDARSPIHRGNASHYPSNILMRPTTTRLVLHSVDHLRRLSLCQPWIKGFTGLFAQSLQIRRLSAGHRLGSGRPRVRILFRVRRNRGINIVFRVIAHTPTTRPIPLCSMTIR